MGVHDGHRQRVKEQFERQGLDAFTDIQALELLLFYVQPRKDTNVTAHNLIDEFGTIKNVLESEVDELCQVEGVGHETALFLSLVGQMARRKELRAINRNSVLRSTIDVVHILRPRFEGATVEKAYVLLIDGEYHPIDCVLLAEGGGQKVHINISRLARIALNKRAAGIILAHNHLIRSAAPSNDDLAMTNKIERTLNALEVQLLDHLIFYKSEYYSIKNGEGAHFFSC